MRDIIFRFIGLISYINPLIPYYHVVSDESLPHISHLYRYKNIKRFLKDIELFCRYFNFVGINDLYDFLYRGKRLKNNSLIITFDDGYAECFSIVAPILFKKGIPAIFFICSEFVDNKDLCYKNKASILIDYLIKNRDRITTEPIIPEYFSLDAKIKFIQQVSYKNRFILDKLALNNEISWEEYLKDKKPYLTLQQLKEMGKMGFYFGGHSKDHPDFIELSIEEQIEQARDSILFIKQALNLKYSLFAFPFNDNNISRGFFEAAKEFIDISFGTNGIMSDEIKWNLQRINFERSLRSADEIYVRKLVRKALTGISRKRVIRRKY